MGTILISIITASLNWLLVRIQHSLIILLEFELVSPLAPDAEKQYFKENPV